MGNSWAHTGDCCWFGVPLHTQCDSPSPSVTSVCRCGARTQLGRVFLEAHCPLCKVRLSSQRPRVPTRCSVCNFHGDNTCAEAPLTEIPMCTVLLLVWFGHWNSQSTNEATVVTTFPGSRCNRRRLQVSEKTGNFHSIFLLTKFTLCYWEGGLMN